MTLGKIALFAALTVASPLSTSVSAEPAKPVRSAKQVQEPDIMGVWEMYPDPYAGENANGFLELPVPGDGPKLKEPYAGKWKAARDKRDAMLKADTPLVDRSTLCLPEGVPMIMGAIFPLQILQTPGQVTVLAEFLTQTRRIHLGKTMPTQDDLNPSYGGYSVGKWEGDTLVVTTRGVREDVEFFEIPHSAQMTITERIRLTGPGLMENQITIDDPKMLAEPYRFTYGYKRNDAYEIMEYICDREDPLSKVNADGTIEMRLDQ